MSGPVRWVSAFLDVTPDVIDAGAAFWAAETGSVVGDTTAQHRFSHRGLRDRTERNFLTSRLNRLEKDLRLVGKQHDRDPLGRVLQCFE